MKFYSHYNKDNKLVIKILARNHEHFKLLYEFAFSHSTLSYDDWLKEKIKEYPSLMERICEKVLTL